MSDRWHIPKPFIVFKQGDRVKSRGDMGGFKMIVVAVHNEYFCTCRYGRSMRHFNMAFLEPTEGVGPMAVGLIDQQAREGCPTE